MEMKDFLPEIKMRGNCCHAALTENSFQPYIYLSRRRVSRRCLLFLQLSNCRAFLHLVSFFSPDPQPLPARSSYTFSGFLSFTFQIALRVQSAATFRTPVLLLGNILDNTNTASHPASPRA